MTFNDLLDNLLRGGGGGTDEAGFRPAKHPSALKGLGRAGLKARATRALASWLRRSGPYPV